VKETNRGPGGGAVEGAQGHVYYINVVVTKTISVRLDYCRALVLATQRVLMFRVS